MFNCLKLPHSYTYQLKLCVRAYEYVCVLVCILVSTRTNYYGTCIAGIYNTLFKSYCVINGLLPEMNKVERRVYSSHQCTAAVSVQTKVLIKYTGDIPCVLNHSIKPSYRTDIHQLT